MHLLKLHAIYIAQALKSFSQKHVHADMLNMLDLKA